MGYRQEIGGLGEAAVADRYVTDGFAVVARNWRSGRSGELDVILARAAGVGTLVVVCEVKTRSSDQFGSGLEAVTDDKQRRLRRLASTWLHEHRTDLSETFAAPFELRIDVAAVMVVRRVVQSIEIVEGAC